MQISHLATQSTWTYRQGMWDLFLPRVSAVPGAEAEIRPRVGKAKFPSSLPCPPAMAILGPSWPVGLFRRHLLISTTNVTFKPAPVLCQCRTIVVVLWYSVVALIAVLGLHLLKTRNLAPLLMGLAAVRSQLEGPTPSSCSTAQHNTYKAAAPSTQHARRCRTSVVSTPLQSVHGSCHKSSRAGEKTNGRSEPIPERQAPLQLGNTAVSFSVSPSLFFFSQSCKSPSPVPSGLQVPCRHCY